MDISEKQAVWSIERPQFEASFIHSFWLTSFDFNDKTGDYEVKPELVDDPDSKLAYEVVNTGWVMWMRAKKQATPDGLVLLNKECSDEMAEVIAGVARVCGGGADDIYNAVVKQAMVEAMGCLKDIGG